MKCLKFERFVFVRVSLALNLSRRVTPNILRAHLAFPSGLGINKYMNNYL